MEKNGIGKKVSLSLSKNDDIPWFSAALEGGPGFCAFLLTIASGLLILATLPLSLFFSIKVSSSFCLSLYNLPQNSSSKEGGSLSASLHCLPSYLIFVIFLHGQNFWRIKFTPKKCVNYDKIHSKLPIFCVITAKYTVNCQFFALNL